MISTSTKILRNKTRSLIISQSAGWLTWILFITHWHPYIPLDMFTTNIIRTFFLQPTHIHKNQISKYQMFPNPSMFIQFSCWCFEPFVFQGKHPTKKIQPDGKGPRSRWRQSCSGSTPGPMVVNIFGCPKKHPEKHQFWGLVGGFNPSEKYWQNWIISSGRGGVNIKNAWNHHPEEVFESL